MTATKTIDIEVYKALLRTDLVMFIEKVFHTVNPGATYKPNWHVRAIAYEINLLLKGDNQQLIVNMPPRYLKSLILSIALPAWILGHNPAARIVCVSYSNDLATKFSRDFQRVVTSAWYKAIFPHMQINPAKQTEQLVETTSNGSRFATSITGTLTGHGCDWLIIDDPLKQDEAESKVARERVNEWYFSTAQNRLNDKGTGRIIIVMQRLHAQDLCGVISEVGGFRSLQLPAIEEKGTHTMLYGDRLHCRKKGDVLHPQFESLEQLERQRKGMGTRLFSAQYQ